MNMNALSQLLAMYDANMPQPQRGREGVSAFDWSGGRPRHDPRNDRMAWAMQAMGQPEQDQDFFAQPEMERPQYSQPNYLRRFMGAQ